MKKYSLLRRTLDDVADSVLPEGAVDEEQLAALPGHTLNCFRHNPYGRREFTWQYLPLLGDEVVGHLGLFPIRLRCGEQMIDAISGSDLYVSPKSRKYGVGINLMEDFFSDIDNDIFVAHGISSMAEPLYKYCGTSIGKVKQLTMLMRSAVKLRFVAKGRLRVLAPFVDAALWAYRLLLSGKLKPLRKFRVVECAEVPQEVDAVLMADKHPYAEWHGHEYLQWIKDFPIYKAASGRKFHAMYDGDEMIGFFLTEEGVESVQHEGKRLDIKRGVVLEWGSKDEKRLPEHLLVLQALLYFRGRVHTATLHAHGEPLLSFLPQTCKMRISREFNWGIKVGEQSPYAADKEIRNMNNWRIRTAMGDVGLL